MYITDKEISINSGEPYVEIVLPKGDRPWIGGINGRFYSISRGIPVKVPANLAELISQNENYTIIAEDSVAEYKSAQGKNLAKGGKKK